MTLVDVYVGQIPVQTAVGKAMANHQMQPFDRLKQVKFIAYMNEIMLHLTMIDLLTKYIKW